MKNIYSEKIEKLELGELGYKIEWSNNGIYISDNFRHIANDHTDFNADRLLSWAKEHVDEVDEQIVLGDATGLYDCIRDAQADTIEEKLYNHKGDILLYYAYMYCNENRVELNKEGFKQLAEYIETLDIDNTTLKAIENYCDELNINK